MKHLVKILVGSTLLIPNPSNASFNFNKDQSSTFDQNAFSSENQTTHAIAFFQQKTKLRQELKTLYSVSKNLTGSTSDRPLPMDNMYVIGTTSGKRPPMDNMYAIGTTSGKRPPMDNMYAIGTTSGKRPPMDNMYAIGTTSGKRPPMNNMYAIGTTSGKRPPMLLV